jgi:hypothetical protein
MLLHAVMDPDQGERCECGALAVVVFLLPIQGEQKRLPWCGERCGACLNGAQPTAYQLLSARRRLRRWWREHNLLGEVTEEWSDSRNPQARRPGDSRSV